MPRPNPNVRCGTCQAWQSRPNNGELGDCHFNAPTDAGREKDWPTLRETSWCMQWQPIGVKLPLQPVAPKFRKVDLT